MGVAVLVLKTREFCCLRCGFCSYVSGPREWHRGEITID